MKYVDFEFVGTSYKLRLTAQTTSALERQLGGNPVEALLTFERGALPKLNDVLLILHASMQKYHHGITVQKVFDLYDAYVEEGNDFTDLIHVLSDVLEVSGFLKRSQGAPESQEANAS